APEINGNQLPITKFGTVIVAQALHSCKKSAIIALTNSAVKYVDFVHTFLFVLFALFVIIFAHFYLFFLFPVSTIDSRSMGTLTPAICRVWTLRPAAAW